MARFYINLRSKIGYALVICATVAILISPWVASADTLYFQPLNSSIFSSNGNIFQGIGEGLFPATTTIENIGFQYQFAEVNHSFGITGSYCIYEYYSRAEFESNPITHPTANSVCYPSGSVPSAYTTDASGFVSTSTNQSYTFAPAKFYAIAPPGWVSEDTILGSNTRFNLQNLIINPGASTSTLQASLYFQVFSGSTPTQFFTPAPGFAGFATSSLNVLCEPPSNILDVGGGVRYGLCTGLSYLFVPNSSSFSSFNSNWENLVTQKFPFSWITDTREILENYLATTTENFPTMTIDFGTTTEFLGFEDLEVISTSTISRYLSEGTRANIKILLSALFYLTAIGFIYRDLQRIWHKQQ